MSETPPSDPHEQTDPIQQRMDHLLDQCIHKALEQIQARGEFYPFGVTSNEQGELTLAHARIEEENPTSDQVTQTILRGLITEASQGKHTTIAIVADVRVRQPGTGQFTDAIRVLIEDREAKSLDFFLPYAREGGKIVTSDIMAQEAPSIVFASDKPSA